MSKSRPTKQDRWNEAIARGREAADAAEAAQELLDQHKQAIADALGELEEMAQEFGEPYDNMTEGLQQTPYGQKCEAMQQLDLGADGSDELDELVSKLDEAEGAEIPLGFGRD